MDDDSVNKHDILETIDEFILNTDMEDIDLTLSVEESEKLLKRLFEEDPNKKLLEFKKRARATYKKIKSQSKKFEKEIFG